MTTIQEVQKMALQDQQDYAIAGFERAVKWVKDHPQSLSHFSAISLSYRLGVEVKLSSWWTSQCDDWQEFIGDLFPGKIAVKKTRCGTLPRDDYTILDEDLGILFSWTVYHETDDGCTEETIKIAEKTGE